MSIIIRYSAKEAVESPQFSLSIFRKDGLQISSPTQLGSESPIDKLNGSGEVCYHIKNLPLLPAEYFISVSVRDELGLKVFDYHDRAYPFRVDPGSNEQRDGLIELPAQWEWRPE